MWACLRRCLPCFKYLVRQSSGDGGDISRQSRLNRKPPPKKEKIFISSQFFGCSRSPFRGSIRRVLSQRYRWGDAVVSSCSFRFDYKLTGRPDTDDGRTKAKAGCVRQSETSLQGCLIWHRKNTFRLGEIERWHDEGDTHISRWWILLLLLVGSVSFSGEESF